MAKLMTLKNKLMKNGLVVSVILLGAATFAYASSFWLDSAIEEERTLANRFRSVEGEITQKVGKNADAVKYIELYSRITGASEQEKISDLSRERAQRWLLETAQRQDIRNLEGSFEPVTLVESPALKKKTLQGIYSQVKLRYSAMSDISALGFAETILNDFPGYVKFTKFVINRKQDITNTLLQDAARGVFTDMVTVELELIWIGVREVAPAAEQTRGQP